MSSGASEGHRAILVFSPDRSTREEIGERLRAQGLPSVPAGTAREAVAALGGDPPLAVIVDAAAGLPARDLGEIVRVALGAPVLVLPRPRAAGTASGGPGEGTGDAGLLSSGSPFLAQLRVVAVVTQALSETLMRAGGVELDAIRHEVRVDGELVWLALKEFELLELLLSFRGRILTPRFLVRRVWGSDSPETRRTLYVHIRRLRQKIEHYPHSPRHLVTVRGRGYKFVAG